MKAEARKSRVAKTKGGRGERRGRKEVRRERGKEERKEKTQRAEDRD